MKIYLYNKNGYYTNKEDAQESPKEPGIFLIPSNATTIKPPVTADNERAKFVNNNWIIESFAPKLQPIGELEIKVIDNNTVRFVLEGDDGVKRKLNFTLT